MSDEIRVDLDAAETWVAIDALKDWLSVAEHRWMEPAALSILAKIAAEAGERAVSA